MLVFFSETDKSQSGVMLTWSGAPIGWISLRQPTASLSTTESELGAAIDGMTLSNAVLYCANIGTCTILQVPQGAWRTRHLRLKAQWSVENIEESKFVYHLPGKWMIADMATKPLQSNKLHEFITALGCLLQEKAKDPRCSVLRGESAAAAAGSTAATANVGYYRHGRRKRREA